MYAVFILTNDITSPEAQLLYERFDAADYDAHIASIDTSRSLDEKRAQWHRMLTVLASAGKRYRGFVVLQDSCVTTVDRALLGRALDAGVENYDLFHLCRWQDACEYKQARAIPDSSMAWLVLLVPTLAAIGTLGKLRCTDL